MTIFKNHFGFVCAALSCTASLAAFAQEASTDDSLEEVLVVAVRDNRISKGATGLPLDIKDTPQSISTLDADEMADFGLTGSNEALDCAAQSAPRQA